MKSYFRDYQKMMFDLGSEPIYRVHPHGLGIVKSWIRIGDAVPDGWSKHRPDMPKPPPPLDITEPRAPFDLGDVF